MDSNNARIAKNTGLLYFRMIFITLINLYAVRVTLDALGDVDYGIYNVVASVVASLSLLTGAMTSASQRFLAYHLGKNDYRSYSRTFTLLIFSFLAISLVLLLVGEGLSYFFIERWLHIPEDRITAAYWVYQTSLVAFFFSFVTIPYTSSIVANERMDAFAAFSVVEGVMKLGIALWLAAYGGDRLILYGILTASISIAVFLMSMQYCHVKFKYCRYILKWEKSIFMQLTGYMGWNLFGSISAILSNQGQAVLLNIYFGPVVNTAKAIADRIQHLVQGFSINLYMAVSPQIIKSYASEDFPRAHNLVLKTSKLAFMLIYVMSFPLICAMESVLRIWLGAEGVTTAMIEFSQLILIYCMVITLEQPITRIIQATGDIKRYQISVGVLTLMYIPVAAAVLALGGSPVMTLVVQIAIITAAQIVRVMVAHRQVSLSYHQYLSIVVIPIIRVTLVSIPAYIACDMLSMKWTLPALLLKLGASAIAGLTIVAILGLTSEERRMIWSIFKKRVLRK